ncbi:MAG: hypothetical protein ABIN18_22435 [Pseudomonadota bacterium]
MMNQENLKECLFKEINLIQDVIKRMASNSSMMKGWAITLVVVTLLLKGSIYQVFISFIPLLSFWVLDAYFLRQERMYRKLYDWVITNRLKSNEYLFNMNAYRFKEEVQSTCRTMFSITLAWFYGLVSILIIAYSVCLLIFDKKGV